MVFQIWLEVELQKVIWSGVRARSIKAAAAIYFTATYVLGFIFSINNLVFVKTTAVVPQDMIVSAYEVSHLRNIYFEIQIK